jgi:hypothetical protein
LRKVTNEDVVRVSGTLFDKKGLSLTALGLSERESATLSLKLAP